MLAYLSLFACIPFPRVTEGRKIGVDQNRRLAVELSDRSRVLEVLGSPDFSWSRPDLRGLVANAATITKAEFFLYTWESVKGDVITWYGNAYWGREGHRLVVEYSDTGLVKDWGEIGEWAIRYHTRKVSETLDLEYPARIPLSGHPSSFSSEYLTVAEDSYLWGKYGFGEVTQLKIFSEEPAQGQFDITLELRFGSPNLEKVVLTPAQLEQFEKLQFSINVIWLPVLLEYLAEVSPKVKITKVDRRWHHSATGVQKSRFNEGGVFAMAIDPTTPTTLYAGTADGVFKSIDSGASWKEAFVLYEELPFGIPVIALEVAIHSALSNCA